MLAITRFTAVLALALTACSSSTPVATDDATNDAIGLSTPATFPCGTSTCTQTQLCLTQATGIDAGVANPPICRSRPNACDDCSCVTSVNTCGSDSSFDFSCTRASDGHLDVTCPGQ